MNVTTSSSGIVMQPQGALDEDGCAALRQVISTALSAGLRHVVIDCSDVTHLELEAVLLLRGVQQYLYRHHGGLVLVNPSPAAARGITANDLSDLLVLGDVPLRHPALRPVQAG